MQLFSPSSKTQDHITNAVSSDEPDEKLKAAKAARLVCLSLLSLTGSFLVLLDPSGSIFSDLNWALLSLTQPYIAFLSLT